MSDEKKLTPFDFVNAINSVTGRNIIVDEYTESQYNPFIINRAFSFGPDTCIQANEMNCRPHVPKKAQNLFLINIIAPRKRYNKWLKADKVENVNIIAEYYGYSYKKAKQALALLSDDQIEQIKEKLYKGGT